MTTKSFTEKLVVEGLTIPEAVTVIGTGNLGSWVAYLSAISGVKKLVIYTVGEVKQRHIGNLPFPPGVIGRPYKEALLDLINHSQPSSSVVMNNAFVTGHSKLEGSVVFDCASSPLAEFNKNVYSECQKNGLKYISGGYLGNSICVCDRPLSGEAASRQEPGPVWCGSAVLAAALMINSAFVKPFNFQGEPADLDMQEINFIGDGMKQ